MKKILLTLCMFSPFVGTRAQSTVYVADSCKIMFFSATPVENIVATNKTSRPVLNTATGEIQIKIAIKAFVFPQPLMQEHFNENYMESDKFPNSIFKGKINEKVDYTKDGDTEVTVTGKMEVHGVTKDATIKGTLSVKGQQILVQTSFPIHIADYNIKVPGVNSGKIAEDVLVKMNASLKPFVQKNK